MNEMITVRLIDLKENKEFSGLVPEMTTTEYQDLVKSIKKHGVRQPIHVLSDRTILDGRHRVRACKEIGVKEVQAVVHELSNNEAIEFVVDTAIERRNLSKEQKVDIVLRSSELIRALEEEAVEYKKTFKGNQHTKVVSGSVEPVTKRTNERIGEMTGTSKATVVRMKKVKNEDPELYEKVVAGEVTPSKAYNELPTVKRAKSEPKQKKEVINPNEDRYNSITQEETELSIAYENLLFNLRQLDMYIEGNENRLFDAIQKAHQETPELLEKSVDNMKRLTNLIKTKEEN